eukprot:TRINITY_DN23094_c0_g1_i1.p1 TRINITY_DN23094_c0_g1~~TRINITY_DN23094_c0_g1_i1.p1  ORF type:complete len:196 (-),score=78.59 TRINITY_DN23094_c0_g1_i1:70-633(-)
MGDYAGFIIPPRPPHPDFDASREKLQRLGEAESGQLTKEEFNKMKQELEAEYLATFKKTVAQHEVFLQRLADKLSACLLDIATLENSNLESFLTKLSDTFEKMRRIEGRVANDQDLKLSDCLRYHMRDTNAAKDLLYRRLRCLANYEKANKELDMARTRNRDVAIAENSNTRLAPPLKNYLALLSLS